MLLIEDLFCLLATLPPSLRARVFRDLQGEVVRPPVLTSRADWAPSVRWRKTI